MASPIPLLAKPYEDRQYIVVVDETAATPIPEESSAKAAKWVTAAVAGAFTTPAFLLGGMAAGALAELIISKTRKAADRGVDIVAVRRADLHGLLFPPGHPRRKVVYVGHPFLKQQYIPLASFHRVLFEQKVIEAMELLAGLGATSIQLEQTAGSKATEELVASLGVPVQGATV